MSIDFTDRNLKSGGNRSGDKLQRAIAEGYNFPVMEVIQKAFLGIKGLKFKFFLSGVIIVAILLALSFLMLAFIPMPLSMPTNMSHMDMQYLAADLLTMGISMWLSMLGVSFIISLLSMIFSAGITLIVIRHIRQQNNPVIPGLFNFFPQAGKIFMIWLLVSIFTFIIPYALGFLMALVKSEALQLIVAIAIFAVIVGIGLIYSLVFYVMADNPELNFWQVMEGSRKLVLNRFLKLLIFYIVLVILLVVFFLILMFVLAFVMQILMMGSNPFTISAGQMFLYMLIPYVVIFVVSLWLVPFMCLLQGNVYMYLINDPSVIKKSVI